MTMTPVSSGYLSNDRFEEAVQAEASRRLDGLIARVDAPKWWQPIAMFVAQIAAVVTALAGFLYWSVEPRLQLYIDSRIEQKELAPQASVDQMSKKIEQVEAIALDDQKAVILLKSEIANLGDLAREMRLEMRQEAKERREDMQLILQRLPQRVGSATETSKSP
jgi:hypothetical protein